MGIWKLIPKQDKDNYPFLAYWCSAGFLVAISLALHHLPFWPVIVWMALGWGLCLYRTMKKITNA